MSTKEKEIVRNITEAVSILPEKKREYILGYRHHRPRRERHGHRGWTVPGRCNVYPCGHRGGRV